MFHPRIATGLFVLAASSVAMAGNNDCSISSDYALELEGKGIAFKSDDALPRHVRMDNGHLYIDGREIELTAGDRATIDHMEGEVREISGEALVIASEGIDLAFDALSEVSAGLIEDSGRRADVVRSMEKTRGIIQKQIRDTVLHRPFNEEAFEALVESQIETLAAELVQVVVGEFVPRAVAAALSGDEKAVADIEARADQMGKDIERRVQGKAKEIEKRAETLCPRVRALVAMQSDLSLRLDDGSALKLIEN